MSWWLQIHGFPKSTCRFNNSLERQNLMKAVTLSSCLLSGRDANLNQPKEEAYRVESRSPNSSFPFQLSTPCGILDSVIYSRPQYTHSFANQESSLMLWCPNFYWRFISWPDSLPMWLRTFQPCPSLENWLTSSYRGLSWVILLA